MNAAEYYQYVLRIIGNTSFVLGTDISFNEIDVNVCYIRGTLILPNDCELHIAEYVITAPSLERPKYRYHLQKTDGSLIARWDNAPHFPNLVTHPDHRHDKTGTPHASLPMDSITVLTLIVPLVFGED